MATVQRHIIGKQHLDVTFNGSESGAMALQSAISELSQLAIAARIERILDRYAADGSVLKIDRLEIDAETMQLSQLEKRLPAMIAEALDKALAETTASGTELTAEANNLPPGRRLSEEEAAVEALLFFLRHATLPATFRPPSHEQFETQLLKAWLRPDLIRQTAEALTSATARQRLLAQFSQQVTATLIEELSPDAMPIIENILDQLRRTSLQKELETKIEHELLDKTLELFATRASIAPAELRETLLTAVRNLSEIPESTRTDLLSEETFTNLRSRTKQRESATDLEGETACQTRNSAPPAKRDSGQSTQSAPDEESTPSGLRRSAKPAGSPATPPNASSDAIAEAPATPDASSSGSHDTSADDRKTYDVTNEPAAHEASAKQPETSSPTPPVPDSGNPRTPLRHTTEPSSEHPDERLGLYVENAGLVLLHPFLPQFFRALRIAGEDELLQPGEALRLLYFLATGSEDAPEYDLVLPKILCGLPPASLAGKSAPLSGEEQEECAALLSAVVQHWDVLKNTGIDALRENFLKRNGKLTRWHDGGWLLQVESNSFDILLDRLPWGFSMIRLPWMPRMLHVEWRF